MHGDVCMHRVMVQKQLKITNTPEYSYSTLGMYIDTYLFTSMYINIAREREREQKHCTKRSKYNICLVSEKWMVSPSYLAF